MTDTTYAFGDRVTFTRSLHRATRDRTERGNEWADFPRHITTKVWTTERWLGDAAPEEPREGIIIGKRTLANGDRDYLGFEEGIAFIPREWFVAYLIAFDMHRNPVYVLPEHITPTTTPENTDDE